MIILLPILWPTTGAAGLGPGWSPEEVKKTVDWMRRPSTFLSDAFFSAPHNQDTDAMTARQTKGPITGKPFWIVQAVVDGRTLTAFGRTWAGAYLRLASRMGEQA